MIVNGKEESLNHFKGVTTLLDLIASLGLKPGAIAIERNGEIPPREEWKNIELKDSDTIELIRFVGGG